MTALFSKKRWNEKNITNHFIDIYRYIVAQISGIHSTLNCESLSSQNYNSVGTHSNKKSLKVLFFWISSFADSFFKINFYTHIFTNHVTIVWFHLKVVVGRRDQDSFSFGLLIVRAHYSLDILCQLQTNRRYSICNSALSSQTYTGLPFRRL